MTVGFGGHYLGQGGRTLAPAQHEGGAPLPLSRWRCEAPQTARLLLGSKLWLIPLFSGGDVPGGALALESWLLQQESSAIIKTQQPRSHQPLTAHSCGVSPEYQEARSSSRAVNGNFR